MGTRGNVGRLSLSKIIGLINRLFSPSVGKLVGPSAIKCFCVLNVPVQTQATFRAVIVGIIPYFPIFIAIHLFSDEK